MPTEPEAQRPGKAPRLGRSERMELFGELAVRESGRPVLLPGEVEVRAAHRAPRDGGAVPRAPPRARAPP